MQTPSESGDTADTASAAGQQWLGKSVWHSPDLTIQSVNSWASITALSYHRGSGEATWRGDRHRLVLTLEQTERVLVEVEGGRARQFIHRTAPGDLAFYPAGVTIRTVVPKTKYVQVLWGTELYRALLPELGTAASGFETVVMFEDPMLSQIALTLAQEVEGGFADRILTESLGTALSIRIAQRFVGRLALPMGKGLSPGRLQRVRDYIEAHLDDDLSLTTLADIACLGPCHFSRSFKEAAGVGLQRYVMQRRLERAKTLMRRTNQPLALIAQEAGFSDQSHLTSIFRREMGVTPGRYRTALA